MTLAFKPLVSSTPEGTTDIRGALRTAHAMKAAAEVKLTEARAAAARGAELVRDAEAEVAECDRVAGDIAERAAQRIAAEAAGGPPAGRVGDRGLGDRLERRARAVSRLGSAQRALGLLTSQVETATGEVARARSAIGSAVEAILMGEAAKLAAMLQSAEELARDLRRELGGLGRLWLAGTEGSPPRSIKLPAAARDILNSRPKNHPDVQVVGDPLAAYLVQWRQLAEALLRDPEAPLPEEQ